MKPTHVKCTLSWDPTNVDCLEHVLLSLLTVPPFGEKLRTYGDPYKGVDINDTVLTFMRNLFMWSLENYQTGDNMKHWRDAQHHLKAEASIAPYRFEVDANTMPGEERVVITLTAPIALYCQILQQHADIFHWSVALLDKSGQEMAIV